MTRRFAVLIAMGIVVTSIGFVAGFVRHHESKYASGIAYDLPCDFPRVRKILIRTNALEEMVNEQHGEIVSKNLSDLTISADRPIRNTWRTEGVSRFVVRRNDPDIGTYDLMFKQTFEVNGSSMRVVTILTSPSGTVKRVRSELYLRPNAYGGTSVFFNSEVVCKRWIPANYQEYMDQRVRAAVVSILSKNQEIITRLVEKHKDSRILLNIPVDRNA